MKRTIKILLLLITTVMVFVLCHEKSMENRVIPTEPEGTAVKSIRIVSPNASGEIMENTLSIFTERIEERSGARIIKDGNAELIVELSVTPVIGTEGYEIINDSNGNIQIRGNDQRGILYGVGKFLHTSSYSKNGFIAGEWRGKSVPKKPIRGIYFAVHMGNFYETAPIEKIERYVEDLALWGINSLLVVPSQTERTERILSTAKGLGMTTGILIETNAIAPIPEGLEADPSGGRGGIVPAVCPSKPGGLEYILENRSVLFDWIGKMNIDYLCTWPYDAGGCGCADCKPWGSNGYLKCVKGISQLAREKLPGTKVMLSTWYFDSVEWAGLSDSLSRNPDWIDVIMAEDIDVAGYKLSYLPSLAGGLPTVGFPEISMYNTFPWGGFGATPLSSHVAGQWKRVQSLRSGGYPYSEGIFDDITKVVLSQLYWDPDLSTDEILKEYIFYEYSPNVVDQVLKVIRTLERNHHMRWWPGKLEGVKLTMDWFPSYGTQPQEDPGAEEAYAVMKAVDATLPEWTKKSWRWRILFIRAMLDAELKMNGGSPNQTCMDGFRELMKIYHVTEYTDPAIRPPIPDTGE